MGKNNNSRDSYLLEYQWHLLPASAATHWHESTNMGGVNGLGPKILPLHGFFFEKTSLKFEYEMNKCASQRKSTLVPHTINRTPVLTTRENGDRKETNL